MSPSPSPTQIYEPELRCQSCGAAELERVLDLGYQPLCNEFQPIGNATQPQTYYPLCLCYCHQCTAFSHASGVQCLPVCLDVHLHGRLPRPERIRARDEGQTRYGLAHRNW